MTDINSAFADLGLHLGKSVNASGTAAADRTVEQWKERITILVEPHKKHQFYQNSQLDKSFSGEGCYVVKFKLGQYNLPPNPSTPDVKSLEGDFPSKAHASLVGNKVLDMIKQGKEWDDMVMATAKELIKIADRARQGQNKGTTRKK